LDGAIVNAELHISGSGTQTQTIESSDDNSSLRLIANGAGHAFIDMEEGPNQRWIAGMYTSDNSYRIASGSAFAATTLFELDQTGEISAKSITLSETGSIAYFQATETMVQYQSWCHNFIAGTSTMGAGDRPFIPWASDDDLSSVPTRNCFLCPHPMTLKELKFACEDVSGIVGTATIKVVLSTTPNGSATEIQQATASFSVQNSQPQVVFTVPSSSFIGSVDFDANEKILISLNPDQDIQPSTTTKDYYITTVWKETISTI